MSKLVAAVLSSMPVDTVFKDLVKRIRDYCKVRNWDTSPLDNLFASPPAT